MNTKVKINRLATGVPGLDDILGGGLPEFSFNLIAGQPGCGKTTLAHQIMFSLATDEHPALYLTVLGEPPLKMLRYQQQFDFFRSDAINDAVRFVNLSDETLTGNLDQVLARIVEEVQEFNPTLVFIDSFRSVVLSNTPATTTQNQLQQFVQQLGILMTSWQATTFLIGEYYADTDANPVFTVADGLIWLHQSVQRNSMVRKIEVMKMRGQSTLPGLHSFRIDDSGVEVFAPICESPRAKPDDALLAARPRSNGHTAPGRHAWWRHARRLFSVGGRTVWLRQECAGLGVPRRGCAAWRNQRAGSLRAASESPPHPDDYSIDCRRPHRPGRQSRTRPVN